MPSPTNLLYKMEAPRKSMKDNSSMPFHRAAFREMLSNVPCILLCSNFSCQKCENFALATSRSNCGKRGLILQKLFKSAVLTGFLGVAL